MIEAIIGVAGLIVGFGVGWLVRGSRSGGGQRAVGSGSGSGDAPQVERRGQRKPMLSDARKANKPQTEVDRILDEADGVLESAAASFAAARERWLEEGDHMSEDGRAALERFNDDVGTLEELLDRLEDEVREGDTAYDRLDAALNELFAASRRIAPFGRGEQADARDQQALEEHEQRFDEARADYHRASSELREREDG